MKIAVLGTGNVGGVLGTRFAQNGHTVMFGSRDPSGDRIGDLLFQAGGNARAASLSEAAGACDVVILATPWDKAGEIVKACGALEGKILVDCTNPLTADFRGLDLGHTTSASERIAGWAPGARVVKAFNTVSAAAMANPVFGDQKATMFYCGDDVQAKSVVGRLADELGFEAVDAGPLQIARYLEPLAMLYIQLAIQEGWGPHYAFKIMKR